MRARLLQFAVITIVVFAAAGVSAAYAVAPSAPATQPQTLHTSGFEQPGPTGFTTNDIVWISLEPTPTAYWGPVGNVHNTGSYSFWCAGTKYPQRTASTYFPTYPAGTRGLATLALPELKDYYSSTAEFWYLYPTRGGADDFSFGVGVNKTDSAGNVIGSGYSDANISTTTPTGWTRKTYTMSDPAKGALSRTPGKFSVQFYDFFEGPSDAHNGQGPAIDDLKISGYEFGPVRNLSATHSGANTVDLSWSTPYQAIGSSNAETRTVAYHVWRAPAASPNSWTEVTPAAGTAATSLTDTSAFAGASRYFVQAFTPTGDAWGDPSGSTFNVAAYTDTTAPTTTISGVPGGWSTSNVTFSLDATDESWNTLTTYYRLNGGTQQTYGAPVTVTAQGTTTVTYWSVDQANQTESAHAKTILIDKTAPVTSASSFTYRAAATDVRLAIAESGSGVATKQYKIDGGAWQDIPPTNLVTVPTAGTHTLYVSSTDVAGNVETPRAITVVVRNYAVESITGAGNDRYKTSVAAAQRAFTNPSTVVVAYGGNFPDALGASAVCGIKAAPLLLTPTAALTTDVYNYINGVHPRKAIIVGGTGVVSTNVENQLIKLVGGNRLNVQRIAGNDRYDTAARVAATVASIKKPYDVFLAVGSNYPDALSSSPVAYVKGWPVLLTQSTGVPGYTQTSLGRLAPARVHILGGTGVVPLAVQNTVQRILPRARIDRWAGADRAGTSIDVANKSGLSLTAPGIATGYDFPDALYGGVMQGKLGNPVLLTNPSALAGSIATWLTGHKSVINDVRYIGVVNNTTIQNGVNNALK